MIGDAMTDGQKKKLAERYRLMVESSSIKTEGDVSRSLWIETIVVSLLVAGGIALAVSVLWSVWF